MVAAAEEAKVQFAVVSVLENSEKVCGSFDVVCYSFDSVEFSFDVRLFSTCEGVWWSHFGSALHAKGSDRGGLATIESPRCFRSARYPILTFSVNCILSFVSTLNDLRLPRLLPAEPADVHATAPRCRRLDFRFLILTCFRFSLIVLQQSILLFFAHSVRCGLFVCVCVGALEFKLPVRTDIGMPMIDIDDLGGPVLFCSVVLVECIHPLLVLFLFLFLVFCRHHRQSSVRKPERLGGQASGCGKFALFVSVCCVLMWFVVSSGF